MTVRSIGGEATQTAGLSRHSRELMGTVASIAVPEGLPHHDAVEAAFARLLSLIHI